MPGTFHGKRTKADKVEVSLVERTSDALASASAVLKKVSFVHVTRD
jgi:hypothetical protein